MRRAEHQPGNAIDQLPDRPSSRAGSQTLVVRRFSPRPETWAETMSAISGASASRATGTWRSTTSRRRRHRRMLAPRKSTASAIRARSACRPPRQSWGGQAGVPACPGSAAVPPRLVGSRCTVGTLWTPMTHTWRPFDSVRFSTGGSLSAGSGPSPGGFERSGACRAVTLVMAATTQSAPRTRDHKEWSVRVLT